MDSDKDFFKIENQLLPPKRGVLLISEPFLPDQYFGQSVVYITEHNAEGTVGFVVNKPIGKRVHELIEGFPVFNAPVSLGGPVGPNTIHFIHNFGNLISESTLINNNLFWGGNFDELKVLVENKLIMPNQVKFFIGYSGWSPGQLKLEIDRGSWIVSSISGKEILKQQSPEYWRQTLVKLGRKYRIMSNFPADPILN
jgi:putative transcriptional regulator